MSSATPEAAPWVLAAVQALNHHGSWTGRIHIHKHLFITQVLELAQPPFDFVLYDYGPYSFGLDDEIVDLELFGCLERSYPKPGYGPRYEPTLRGLEGGRAIRPVDAKALGRVAAGLGDSKSQDLELIATCLWMERRERVARDDEIVQRVRRVKPKYDEPDIREGLRKAHDLATQLAAKAD